MKVSAVVVSHGHASELAESLPALAPQVDELVVIANIPGSVGELLRGACPREPAAAHLRGERERGRRGNDGRDTFSSRIRMRCPSRRPSPRSCASQTSIDAPGSSGR